MVVGPATSEEEIMQAYEESKGKVKEIIETVAEEYGFVYCEDCGEKKFSTADGNMICLVCNND